MKITRYDRKIDIKRLVKELNEILPQTIPTDGIIFKKRYNWDYTNFDDHIVTVTLLRPKYADKFIKVCKKYDVDELTIYKEYWGNQ